LVILFLGSFGYSEHSGVPGERKCSSNFDGWNGVLAHAFAPQDGRVHFDEKEWWSAYENHGLFKQPLPQVRLVWYQADRGRNNRLENISSRFFNL